MLPDRPGNAHQDRRRLRTSVAAAAAGDLPQDHRRTQRPLHAGHVGKGFVDAPGFYQRRVLVQDRAARPQAQPCHARSSLTGEES